MNLKRLFLFLLTGCVLLFCDCQNTKKFEYQKLSTGNYLVTPVFKQREPVGDLGLPYVFDQGYVNKLFSDLVLESITKEKRDSLHFDSMARITFDIMGEILSCEFIINAKDLNFLTEDDLFHIYNKLIQTKVDLTKVTIQPDKNIKAKTGDYAYLSCKLIQLTAYDYDHISLNDLYSVIMDSDSNNVQRVRFDSLCDIDKIEHQFGKSNKIIHYKSLMDDRYLINIQYDDGLEFEILDSLYKRSSLVTFHIKSSKYVVETKSGKTIKVGMKASELRDIFPKSFYRAKMSSSNNNQGGKFRFRVNLSYYQDQELFLTDSSLIFILSKDGNSLAEFYLFEPS